MSYPLDAPGRVVLVHVAMTDNRPQAPFPELVPSLWRDLMDPADPEGPIARQVLASGAENVRSPEERDDPIGDRAYSPVEGIVHRHPNRVLLKPTGVCAVHCRFCFRRHDFAGGRGELSPAMLERALDYIKGRSEIRETILTGGDPLMLAPESLLRLADDLAAIPHLDILRLHSRVPLAAPERVTRQLVSGLTRQRLTVFVVIHCNHPLELTPEAAKAIARLVDAGIPVMSQTVLLKGVNDRADILAQLMHSLLKARVKPYYLHHCDLVPGTGHFRCSLAEGRALVEELRTLVSGLAMPTYVLDIPGGAGKVPAGSDHLAPGLDEVRDIHGGRHPYPG